MLLFDDTIAAISTPTGRGGIGVVRLSGPLTFQILAQLFPNLDLTAIQRAQLTKLRDLKSGDLLDEAVVTLFQAPRSYTGQDVAEISCHGSPFILSQLLKFCFQLGARAATPGEYTLRAFTSGRIDLTQAEAVRDLIDAQTEYQARMACRQMKGELSNYLQPIKEELLNIIVHLESAVEFVEENLDVENIERLRKRIAGLVEKLARLANSYQYGRVVRDGIKIAIIGRPNVGKSSLFNALLQQDRAIVTDIPGTTRDSLIERASIHGIPVTLVDTAGIRQANDLVEKLGIERSYGAMTDADLVIMVIDGSQKITKEDRDLFSQCQQNPVPFVLIVNKIDLIKIDLDQIEKDLLTDQIEKDHIFFVSTLSFEGMEHLQQKLAELFLGDKFDSRQDLLLLDARHFSLINATMEELHLGVQRLQEGFSEEVALCHLHLGLKNLGEITGETTVEDILGRIFSTFCIGK